LDNITWYAVCTGWAMCSSSVGPGGFSFELERTGEVPAVKQGTRGVGGVVRVPPAIPPAPF